MYSYDELNKFISKMQIHEGQSGVLIEWMGKR